MTSVNKVILIGRVGKDPEIKVFNDMKYARFNIATNNFFKGTGGEKVEQTDWHRISVSDKFIATVVENYIRKGSLVYLEGTLSNKKYTDKQGVEKTSVEVCIKPFSGVLTLLDGKENNSDNKKYQSSYNNQSSHNKSFAPVYSTENKEAFSIGGVPQPMGGAVYNDEIPF